MAGRFVHAFRKPTKQEFIPFQDIREDLLEKEAKSVSRWECGQGSVGVPSDPVLSKTAGAGGEFQFLNGLIAWPA